MLFVFGFDFCFDFDFAGEWMTVAVFIRAIDASIVPIDPRTISHEIMRCERSYRSIPLRLKRERHTTFTQLFVGT